jgi:hypothetical protein
MVRRRPVTSGGGGGGGTPGEAEGDTTTTVDESKTEYAEWECVDMFVVSKSKGPQRDEDFGGSSQVQLLDAKTLDNGSTGLVRVTCARPLIATDACCDRAITKTTQGYTFAFGSEVR